MAIINSYVGLPEGKSRTNIIHQTALPSFVGFPLVHIPLVFAWFILHFCLTFAEFHHVSTTFGFGWKLWENPQICWLSAILPDNISIWRYNPFSNTTN
jgi:hypothetical protein